MHIISYMYSKQIARVDRLGMSAAMHCCPRGGPLKDPIIPFQDGDRQATQLTMLLIRKGRITVV